MIEHLIELISTLLSCLLCYYIGKHKAHSDILRESSKRTRPQEF